jgi:hypothetical protein
MKKLLLALALAAIAGCTNLNDGKSLTKEVTAQPSPAFMKKVAGDPFPAAGASVKSANGASRPAAGQTPQNGASGGVQSITPQSGTIQFGPATPSGTAKKGVTAKR